MRCVAVLLLAVVCFFAAPAQGQPKQKYVAVLELKPTGKLYNIQVGPLTDLVREGAVRALQNTDFTVMTSESVIQILKALGKTPEQCTGECETEVGRELGADYIATGTISKLGRRYLVQLRLYRTDTGALLSTQSVKDASIDGIVDKLTGAGQLLFSVGLGLKAPMIESVAEPGADYGHLEIESNPSKALVYIDDVLVGRTPLKLKKQKKGRYELRIVAEGYEPAKRTVSVEAGKVTAFNMVLSKLARAGERRSPEESETRRPASGNVTYELSFEPEPVYISIDGRDETKATSPYTFQLERGRTHEVEVSRRLYDTQELQLTPPEEQDKVKTSVFLDTNDVDLGLTTYFLYFFPVPFVGVRLTDAWWLALGAEVAFIPNLFVGGSVGAKNVFMNDSGIIGVMTSYKLGMGYFDDGGGDSCSEICDGGDCYEDCDGSDDDGFGMGPLVEADILISEYFVLGGIEVGYMFGRGWIFSWRQIGFRVSF